MRDAAKASIIEELRRNLRGLEKVPLEHAPARCISSGIDVLDALLPSGGLPLGNTIELLEAEPGSGAATFALQLMRGALQRQNRWAVLDADGTFYPPAAAQLGLDLSKLVLLRCEQRDAAWTFGQLLRCHDLGTNLFLHSRSMDNMTYRRLQLAAERGGNLGFIIRPAAALKRPCWSALRLWVEPVPAPLSARRVRLKVLHARGGSPGKTVTLDLLDATVPLPVPAGLAAAAAAAETAGN